MLDSSVERSLSNFCSRSDKALALSSAWDFPECATSNAASEDSRSLAASASRASFSISTAINRARTAGDGIASIFITFDVDVTLRRLTPDKENAVDFLDDPGVVVWLVEACCSPAT